MDEIKRVYVLQQVEEKKLSGRAAAQRLGLSIRQVRRLLVKYRGAGATGLAHGNRGRAPHNRVDEEVRKKIQELSEEEYRDYNDSHFTEELAEEHGLVLYAAQYVVSGEKQGKRAHASVERHATGVGGNARRRLGCCCRPMAAGMTGWKDGGHT